VPYGLDGKIIADDDAKVSFETDRVAIDGKTGKPVAEVARLARERMAAEPDRAAGRLPSESVLSGSCFTMPRFHLTSVEDLPKTLSYN